MRVLLVEDQRSKREQLAEFVRDYFESHGRTLELLVEHSYTTGLRTAVQDGADFMILDMSMPTYDYSPDEPGGRPRHFGGRDIMRELRRRKVIIPTVICTGFDVIGVGREQRTLMALNAELKEQFPECYIGTVRYQPSLSTWKTELSQFMTSFLADKP